MGQAKRNRDSKTVLISRPGAYGDVLIMTPLLPILKKQGYYIIFHTATRGEQVLRNNPYIDRFILKKDGEVPKVELHTFYENLVEKLKPTKAICGTEYIETVIAIHPRNPEYVYPKYDRAAICNKNYYAHTFDHAGMEYESRDLIPQLFFDDKEIAEAKGHLRKDKFNVLWCLAGSGNNKSYPHIYKVWEWLLEKHDDIHIITVGDNRCVPLTQTEPNDNITHLVDKISMRIAMCMTQYVGLVISPDTGILHASGCYDTPKIGLLGHTNIENITKHFRHDYSLESKAECAPCFRLMYVPEIFCPRDEEWGACWCMLKIDPEDLFNRINSIKGRYYDE